MPLWTEVIDPATLTGYARARIQDVEKRKGTLARWLPNKLVDDTIVRFVRGATGLVEEARFRAYDAEPEFTKAEGGARVIIELPAISQKIPVSEYQQLRQRRAGNQALLNQVLATTDRVVDGIVDRIERLRGTVLVTGKATVTQKNFQFDDNFGRDSGLTLTAGTLWNTAGVDRLAYLQTLYDLFLTTNNEAPGAIVMSTRVFRALQSGTQFATQLGNGASRPASATEVRLVAEGNGLPPMYLYDRKTSGGLVVPNDTLLMLPSPVDTSDAAGTQLGATFWGSTLTGTDASYALKSAEAPGLVAGAYRNETPPLIAEVIGDAISLPVLANANLSLAAKVL